jgi:hypothetical protein
LAAAHLFLPSLSRFSRTGGQTRCRNRGFSFARLALEELVVGWLQAIRRVIGYLRPQPNFV